MNALIVELNHVALHVSDLEKSIDFYEHKLGFRPLPRPAFDFKGAWYSLGRDKELHLIAGRELPVYSNSRGTHFAIQVSDVLQVEAWLVSRQVHFRPTKKRPDGPWQIFLEDPDGHVIEFTQL